MKLIHKLDIISENINSHKYIKIKMIHENSKHYAPSDIRQINQQLQFKKW